MLSVKRWTWDSIQMSFSEGKKRKEFIEGDGKLTGKRLLQMTVRERERESEIETEICVESPVKGKYTIYKIKKNVQD